DVRDARRDEITRPDEDPEARRFAILHDNVVGRQRGPTDDIVIALSPLHPGRAPFLARDPAPCKLLVVDPATIVIGHPAPARFGIVFDPVPAPVVGVDPVTSRIRPPVTLYTGRNPDLAPARMPLPSAMILQGRAELDRDRRLRMCRRDHEARDRRT